MSCAIVVAFGTSMVASIVGSLTIGVAIGTSRVAVVVRFLTDCRCNQTSKVAIVGGGLTEGPCRQHEQSSNCHPLSCMLASRASGDGGFEGRRPWLLSSCHAGPDSASHPSALAGKTAQSAAGSLVCHPLSYRWPLQSERAE